MSSRARLQYKEPGSAQYQQHDSNNAGYGEQSNSPGPDARAPKIDAQGPVNDGQSIENAGYGDSFVGHDEQNDSLRWDDFALGNGAARNWTSRGQSVENVWSESNLAARLLAEMNGLLD